LRTLLINERAPITRDHSVEGRGRGAGHPTDLDAAVRDATGAALTDRREEVVPEGEAGVGAARGGEAVVSLDAAVTIVVDVAAARRAALFRLTRRTCHGAWARVTPGRCSIAHQDS
jgi:hypothetical protein